MEIKHATELLSALAQENRLVIYRCLVQAGDDGLAVGQIGQQLGLSGATLSFHLRTLKQAGLIHCTRQGRSLIYSANYPVMNTLLSYLTENCCNGDSCPVSTHSNTTQENVMSLPLYNILFLCTGNSARSIMAEALMQHWGQGRFNAYSAGSQPSGQVNPLAIQLLKRFDLPTEGLRSKSWEEFALPDSPHLDFVITVCDNAANETCPIWPGQPLTSHWGAPDPAAVQGDETEKIMAFREAFRILENRIKLFSALRMDALERMRLKETLDKIGQTLPDTTTSI